MRGASPGTAAASCLSGSWSVLSVRMHVRVSWAVLPSFRPCQYQFALSIISEQSYAGSLAHHGCLGYVWYAGVRMRTSVVANVPSCQLNVQRTRILCYDKLIVIPTTTRQIQHRRRTRSSKEDGPAKPQWWWRYLGKHKPNGVRLCLQDEVRRPGTPCASETYHPCGFM